MGSTRGAGVSLASVVTHQRQSLSEQVETAKRQLDREVRAQGWKGKGLCDEEGRGNKAAEKAGVEKVKDRGNEGCCREDRRRENQTANSARRRGLC